MVTAEQWQVLDSFRATVEAEYTKNVATKPERLISYDDTVGVLKDSLEKYGIESTDPEQVFYFLAGMASSISFIHQYFNVVCHDPHMMAHLGEAATFLGYLSRELCFDAEAPEVAAQ